MSVYLLNYKKLNCTFNEAKRKKSEISLSSLLHRRTLYFALFNAYLNCLSFNKFNRHFYINFCVCFGF